MDDRWGYLWEWTSPPMLALYLAALIGHTALHVHCLNVFLSRPWPRLVTKIVRKANTVFVFAGPIWLWLAFAACKTTSADGWPIVRVTIVAPFIALGAAAPLLHLRYLLGRMRPAALLGNHTEVVDYFRAIDPPPVGDGKRRRCALWPGNELFQVEFSERTIACRRLPATLEGLTILHLSDLHFHGTPDKRFFQAVVDRCNDWRPDIVALTGDIVDDWHHHRWIVPILGPLQARLARVAILGNHDLWYEPSTVRKLLRQAGFMVLGNHWTEIASAEQRLVIIGNEAPWFTPTPVLDDCPMGFRVCLSHTPDNFPWARRNDVDLVLAGHNHGGQIRLPGIGSVYVPSRYGRRYDCGLFLEGGTIMHVSRGLSGQYPIRYRCRPEVTLLRLVRSAEANSEHP